MKRNWDVVQNILEHIEKGDLVSYCRKECYLLDLGIDKGQYLEHLNLMLDAGIVRQGVEMTMIGHDLLDAMRNKSFWTKLKAKAVSSGLTLSWEFIKVAIPVVIKESL